MKHRATPIDLGDDVFAVRFRFYRVTELTMLQSLSKEFMNRLTHRGLAVKFAPEDAEHAGALRADAGTFERMWPDKVLKLKQLTKGQPLANFVLFRVKPKEKKGRD